ncbi:hypothetical protein SAMN05446037_1001374 [Anaerovirgula multivorans]|uniref:Uncharacterized protein n=1 Tax=Anaerovirgula multivorans TaxID=312168 RepID=A0A239A8L0_9FIRM|nr:hypothetical protein [Anaerovirgula multivorans]SNR91213.1 hypothetical protein SAMN05446037_1001374 [Anaerovirgula multivorans]
METRNHFEEKLTIKELKRQQYYFIYEAIMSIIEFSLLVGCFFGLLMLLFEAYNL